MPAIASRVRNVLRTSKKVSTTPIDHINQQAVATYVREAIWPGNKMLPMSWSKWRDDKRSLCHMIQKKVALPLAVGNDTSNHKRQVLLTEGKCHARVV